MTDLTPLDRAIAACDGVSALGAAIGQASNTVSNWRMRGRVPAEHCLAVESATRGLVTRYQLRPDVFGPEPTQAASDKSSNQRAA